MSSMLGIVEAIGTLFGNLLTWLMNTVVAPLLQTLVGAALKSVIYSIASILYNISRFLLALIDFVEVLFRALAGLPNDEVTIVMEGSSSTNPDLLIQMLTSQTVIDAFLSCCIVGIFLLLMTTIFQIIKVEYTTEGAQNSKSSIIGKSLKQFANLLLIPVLVIFGVFIGNTVLDLIDTATSGANKTKISGLLWTTAASDAMWKGSINGESFLPDFLTEVVAAGGSLNPEMLVTIGAMWGLVEGFADGIGNWGPDSDKQFKLSDSYLLGDSPEDQEYRDFVESKFMSEDVNAECSYGNLAIVLKYYNIFSVNYLVLIFGACVIIKCLYHVCFGMIDRIYQCVALFIVSPFVIGMAPVKDSLGSWRSKFIQKALSAYGTIISMNLFFIITDLFMSIDISFMPNMTASVVLGMSLMEGLVKSLFIIVGSLMIEKLSGDLGQYFGGGNAISEGKGLADDATKGIKNVVKTGVGVAGMMAGGVGLAVKGVSMAAKLGKGAMAGIKGAKAAGKGNRMAGFKEGFTGRPSESSALADYDKATEGFSDADFNDMSVYEEKKEGLKVQREASQTQIEHYNKMLSSGKLTEKEKSEITMKRDKETKKLDSIKESEQKFKDSYSDADRKMFDNAIEKKNTLDGVREHQKEKDEKNKLRRDKLQTNYNAFMQYGKDFGGSMPGMNVVNDLKKDWDSARKTGNSYSEEGKQVLKNVEDAKAKKQASRYDNDPINSKFINQNRAEQNQLITKAIIEKAEFKTSDLNNQMDKLVKSHDSLVSKLAAELKKDEKEQDKMQIDSWKSDLEYVKSSMRNLNPKVQFEDNKVINATIEFDLTDFKVKMQEAIKKNASAAEVEQIVADQIKKWGADGNDNVLKEIRKVVEELKNEMK